MQVFTSVDYHTIKAEYVTDWLFLSSFQQFFSFVDSLFFLYIFREQWNETRCRQYDHTHNNTPVVIHSIVRIIKHFYAVFLPLSLLPCCCFYFFSSYFGLALSILQMSWTQMENNEEKNSKVENKMVKMEEKAKKVWKNAVCHDHGMICKAHRFYIVTMLQRDKIHVLIQK